MFRKVRSIFLFYGVMNLVLERLSNLLKVIEEIRSRVESVVFVCVLNYGEFRV